MVAVVVITVLGSTAAKADDILNADGSTTVTAGGYVTAIDNITLNGQLYNVTFTSTGDIPTFSSLDFNDLTTDVVDPIDTDLGMKMLGPGPIGSGMNEFYVAGNQLFLANSVLEFGGGQYVWIASDVEVPWPCSNSATPCDIPSGEIFANITSASVPEVNPSSGTSAIVLLACAVMIIRGRRTLPTP
jgi:hypothetical protein